MLCVQCTVMLVITLLNSPPAHTLEVLPSKAFIFQSDLHGHLTYAKRSTMFVEEEDMDVPKL